MQVVGGLNVEQAVALARKGLRPFVISGNLGLPGAKSRYSLSSDEIERSCDRDDPQARRACARLALAAAVDEAAAIGILVTCEVAHSGRTSSSRS